MANDGFAYSAQSQTAPMARWLPEIAFTGFLLLVFVGLTPFQVRVPGAFQVGAATGAGDAFRQISYLLVFTLLGIAALQRRSLEALTAVPVSILLLLGWCFLSALWADVPGITIRRAGLELVVVFSAMLGVDTLGPRRALQLLRIVLIGVLIVNWVSIFAVPQAVHLPGENDPSLVGDWRGLYFHKNIAGAVCAITAMVLLYFAAERKSRLDFALALAAIGFAVMTRSKSSLGFLPIALLLGAVYRWGWKQDLDRLIVTISAALIAVIVAVYAVGHMSEISHVLENPQEFTGRSAIWQAELGYIADHPLLGSGYGTFADTGVHSPLANYVDAKWVTTVAHGHNGYLQLMVTTGLIGFALAMIALLVIPAAGFWRRRPGEDLHLKGLLFALFCFVVLHNLLESDYLESDGVTWVTFLMTLAMLWRPAWPKR